jgi:saccharopine dehydrogenase-like NADP-dependent oxidoreductase
VSGIYTAYAAKHHFDEIQYLDIVDCNAGNHHKAFATNFNPEINIREITQNGRYYENGEWVTTKPLEIHKDLAYCHPTVPQPTPHHLSSSHGRWRSYTSTWRNQPGTQWSVIS